MFDSLKKRLKEALNKASKAIIGKEKQEETAPALPIEETREIAEPPIEISKEAGIEIPKDISAEITKTKERSGKKSIFQRLIKRAVKKELSENDIEPVLKELNKVLLENDVALETAERICADVRANLVGKDVSRGRVEDAIKDALRLALLDVMSQDKVDMNHEIEKKWEESKNPYLVMFFGFNGTGKTTTISKFTHRYKKYSPVIAAGDTFRAASIEQLEEHARRLGVELVKHRYGADSAAVIFDAVKHATAKGSKLVLADTAGRSHSNVNLMDELKKVVRVNKPDLKILVLDSLTGNDIYEQSRLFNEAVGVDAIILTKADLYEKGGAALSAAHTIKKPILFLGTGQNYGDLKEFNAEEIVKNLLGQ